MDRAARKSRRRIVALAAVTALAVAGCGDSSTGEGGQAVQGTATAGASALKGVCPDTVVFQTNWWPQAEYGGLYRLVGANPTIDSAKNKVTGALVDNGVDTASRSSSGRAASPTASPRPPR